MTPDDDEFARAFIATLDRRFTVASTVKEHPHEYVARSWLSAEDQARFDRLVRLIESFGYRGSFWGSTWTYLDHEGFAYWPSQSWYGPDAGKPGNDAQPPQARHRPAPPDARRRWGCRMTDEFRPEQTAFVLEDADNGHVVHGVLYESWRGFRHDRIGVIVVEAETGETTSMPLLTSAQLLGIAEWAFKRYGSPPPLLDGLAD